MIKKGNSTSLPSKKNNHHFGILLIDGASKKLGEDQLPKPSIYREAGGRTVAPLANWHAKGGHVPSARLPFLVESGDEASSDSPKVDILLRGCTFMVFCTPIKVMP